MRQYRPAGEIAKSKISSNPILRQFRRGIEIEDVLLRCMANKANTACYCKMIVALKLRKFYHSYGPVRL